LKKAEANFTPDLRWAGLGKGASSMLDPMWFLLGMAIPGLLAQGFYVTYCWPLKSPRPGRVASAWAIGPGAGFVVGCQAVGGMSAGTGEYRLLMFLLPAIMLVALACAMEWIKGWKQDAARVVVALAAPATMLLIKYSGDEPAWAPMAAAAWLAGLGAWMAVSWIGVAKLDHEENGRVNAFVVGLTTALGGLAIAFNGSAKYGQMVGTLAFAAGCVWGVSWLTQKKEASRGFEGAVTPVLLCMLILGSFFAGLPLWQGAVIGASPLLLWLGAVPWLKRKGTKGQIAVGAVALAPVVTIAIIGGMEFMHRMAEEF
jgi:hypothetical protein